MLAQLALKQLEAYIPYLQTQSIPSSWTNYVIDWLTRLIAVAFCATAFNFTGSHSGIWANFRMALWPTAEIRNGGAYRWIASYVSHDPAVLAQLRDRIISAEDEQGRDVAYDPSDYDFGPTYAYRQHANARKPKLRASDKGGVVASVGPVADQCLVVIFRDRKLWVTRTSERHVQGATWQISTWYWNRDLVDEFIVEAHRLYHQKKDKEIRVYNHNEHALTWQGPIRRPTRSWDTVILPTAVKEDLLTDVKEFMSDEEKEWYASKGIPYRRGYLLHGPPGAGKTTLATAIASKLNLDLYCVDPSAAGMDDGRLASYFQTCPSGSIVFIEDIDCVMPTQRDVAEWREQSDGYMSPAKFRKRGLASTVTLSGLLNAIDGVTSQEGSVLFASTNFPDSLDAALRRPGRFDVDVPFSYATHEQAAGLFKHFYAPPAMNSAGKTSDLVQLHEKPDFEGTADEFGRAISEAGIEVSLATIQGYLLVHKRDPIMAQQKVGEWIEEMRAKQVGTLKVDP